MDDDTCPICMETYTAKVRQRLKCQHCPTVACRPCQQRALLNSYEDPHCFSCKAGWSPEFMASSFPLVFRNQTLRLHRRRILYEREKAMLPAMQVFVEAMKAMRNLEGLRQEAYVVRTQKYQDYRALQIELSKIYPEYSTLRQMREAVKHNVPGVTMREDQLARYRVLRKEYKEQDEKIKEFHKNEYGPCMRAEFRLDREYRRWTQIYSTGEDPGATPEERKEKRQFLMRCPAEGCRGFLSTAYVCGVCDKKTCSECLELLAEGEHTCNKDSVESAKAIKKETRPCPKCGARIFKIDGCDQMFCTVEGCGTAFSWTTGAVATGRIHNPHYYEWLRRNGGGTAPREAGDIPCGGLPAGWHFARTVVRDRGYEHSLFPIGDKNLLLEIHRNLVEFESRLREYPAVRPAAANKEINVKYLMNELTEEEWQRQLEFSEARFNRKREIGQILQTLVTAAAEILTAVVERLEEVRDAQVYAKAVGWIQTKAIPMLESLRVYTNDAFKALGKAQHMAVPQINDKWVWMGVRIRYKESKKPAGTTAQGGAEDSDKMPPLIDEVSAAVINEVI